MAKIESCRQIICQSPRFLLALVLLGIAVFGLGPLARGLQHRYQKHAIPIRQPLTALQNFRLSSFDSSWKLLNWQANPQDIDTGEFLYQKYNRSVINPVFQATLGITWYSDPASKVPHNPEVCYHQGGALTEWVKNVRLNIPGLISAPELKLANFRFSDYHEMVVYVFCAEGKLLTTRNAVRWVLGCPGNRRTYFSLITCSVSYRSPTKQEEAQQLCQEMMRQIIPLLRQDYFPPDQDLR